MLLLLQTVEEADPPQVHRSLFGRRKYLYLAILVVLTLVAIEAGLKFLYSLRDKEPTAHQQVARITPYANLDWPKEYFAEQSRTKNQFVPYLMWRHQDFTANTSTFLLKVSGEPGTRRCQKARQ